MKTIICMAILFGLILNTNTVSSQKKEKINAEKKQNRNYVPDKNSAIKIAEIIWLPIYGKEIYESRPFVASLKNDSIWVVEGTLNAELGGVPYIEILKRDCRILKVTHGK